MKNDYASLKERLQKFAGYVFSLVCFYLFVFMVESLLKDLNDEIDELKEKIKTLQGNCQLVVSQINY